MEKTYMYLAMWMWLCEDKLKVKIAHFQLSFMPQKHMCLSSLISKTYFPLSSAVMKAVSLLSGKFKLFSTPMNIPHVQKENNILNLNARYPQQHAQIQ